VASRWFANSWFVALGVCPICEEQLDQAGGMGEIVLQLADEYDRTSYVFEQLTMGEGN
jgi:hypothetical protein